MCRLRNIAMRDYQESVTTGQTDTGQSDPYVPLCFAGDTKSRSNATKVEVAKGNNSSKSQSNKTKVELDLYHVKTKSYAKFQVKISKNN